jgi:hypothetical protein
LLVDRNGNGPWGYGNTNAGSEMLVDGLPRDEKTTDKNGKLIYGPYRKGEHGYNGVWYPYYDRFLPPNKDENDLQPIDDGKSNGGGLIYPGSA